MPCGSLLEVVLFPGLSKCCPWIVLESLGIPEFILSVPISDCLNLQSPEGLPLVAFPFLTKHPTHALATEFNFRMKRSVLRKRLRLCFGLRSDWLHENRKKKFFLFGLISLHFTSKFDRGQQMFFIVGQDK